MEPPENDPYQMNQVEPTIEDAYTPGGDTGRAILYSLYLAFLPHARNSATRKYVTVILFATWATVTVIRYISAVDGGPRADEVYWVMTVMVASIVSHLWGFEYGVLSAITAKDKDTDDED